MRDVTQGSLVDLWVASCTRYASSVLLQQGEAAWTYAGLFGQSSRVAAWLKAHGLQPGDRVAILLPNGPAYVAAYFGAMMAGAIAVPLNPTGSGEDAAAAIAHCEPSVMIDARRWDDIVRSDAVDAGAAPTAHPIAQIAYTSGTSSRPKGVTLSHENLASNVRSVLAYLRLTADDGVLAILPFHYAYGTSVLLTHIAAGGRLVLSDFVFVQKALDLIESGGVTGFSGVPASFASLLRHSDFRSRRFHTLRYLTCAGGALSREVVAELVAAQPDIELHVMYGQTEAGPRLSSLPPSDAMRKLGSIGLAIPGVELSVRRTSGELCGVGETGELYARGPNIMHGYWRDPEATASVLTEHGLRTGDLAHVDQDGYLYFDGRTSHTIKSGGYRVNPEEIEAALQAIDGVEAVVVAGIPDEQMGEAIAAFIQVGATAAIDRDLVLEYSRRVLPRHKQVRHVVFVDELPRTPTGKPVRSGLKV